jgi:protein ImuA
MEQASRLELIRDLKEKSRRLESSRQRADATDEASTACVSLERVLLGQDLERGALIEWQSAGHGSGALMLALAVAARVLRCGGMLVLIDEPGEFYPPGLVGLGIPLERTIIVRPGDRLAGLWAWEQALRCSAVAVTLGRADGLNDRLFHRFQLAAKTGGGLGFLLSSATRQAALSKATIRLRVSALPSVDTLISPLARRASAGSPSSSLARRANGEADPLSLIRRLRVEMLHCRGGVPGAVAEVELGHATNPVHLVSSLADPALAARPAHA